MRRTSTWELTLVVVGVLLLLSQLNVAYADATVNATVTNQSVTVDYDNASQLTATDVVRYHDNATVYNGSGALLENGTDYAYRPANGTIAWFNTTNTTVGETSTATFDYTTHQAAARTVATLLGPLGEVWGFLVLFAAGGAILYYGIDRGGF